MIVVNNLSYRYRHTNKNVLHEIKFSANAGEIVAIVGQNGSGKSTLGKLLSGILRPPKNRVTIDNLDPALSKNHQAIFQKVGIVFQNPENQILFQRVDEELNFSTRNIKDSDAKIRQALHAVGMQEYYHANLTKLSLGQKQRIVLAEMLVRNPNYLILDEPTTMLDTTGKITIHQIITRLRSQNIGIILITNIAEELLLADRILILENGSIVAEILKQKLLAEVATLQKYHIALPQLLQLVNFLQKAGLEVQPDIWTPKALAQEIIHACI